MLITLLPRVLCFIFCFALLSFLSPQLNAQTRSELPNAPSHNENMADNYALGLQQTDPSGMNVRDLVIASYKKPKVIDRQFILLNTFQVLAAVADAETTLSCLNSPSCREVNPILGSHPTRGRVYAIGVPLTALSVYLSYHYKRKGPTRSWWKAYPLTLSAVHTFAAINNFLVSR